MIEWWRQLGRSDPWPAPAHIPAYLPDMCCRVGRSRRRNERYRVDQHRRIETWEYFERYSGCNCRIRRSSFRSLGGLSSDDLMIHIGSLNLNFIFLAWERVSSGALEDMTSFPPQLTITITRGLDNHAPSVKCIVFTWQTNMKHINIWLRCLNTNSTWAYRSTISLHI